MVTLELLPIDPVLTVKVAEVCAEATVTDEGVVNAVSLSDSETTAPPVEAA